MDLLAFAMRGSYTAIPAKLVAYFSSWGMLGVIPVLAMATWASRNKSLGVGRLIGPALAISMRTEQRIIWGTV